jgi:hypothetical protein
VAWAEEEVVPVDDGADAWVASDGGREGAEVGAGGEAGGGTAIVSGTFQALEKNRLAGRRERQGHEAWHGSDGLEVEVAAGAISPGQPLRLTFADGEVGVSADGTRQGRLL